jgi:hypothetical protein
VFILYHLGLAVYELIIYLAKRPKYDLTDRFNQKSQRLEEEEDSDSYVVSKENKQRGTILKPSSTLKKREAVRQPKDIILQESRNIKHRTNPDDSGIEMLKKRY